MKKLPTMKTVADYCDQNSVRSAMDHFRVSYEYVMESCQIHGVDPLNKPALERREIAEWVDENRSTAKQAADEFGCTERRVLKACRDFGVEVQTPGKKTIAMSTLEIIAELAQGYTGPEIAEKFGVTRQRVNQIKQKATKARLIGPKAVLKPK